MKQAALSQAPAAERSLRVIPNPIDIITFVPPPSPRTPPARGNILYTGRIHPEKGVHILVQAFKIINAEFPETKLTLIGPQATAVGGGGSAYIEELRALGAGLPMELRPPISDPKELAEELWKASLYCYPSLAERGESFGVAPLEAMATGLPVVVSKLLVFSDFVTDGETGLVFDHRADQPDRALAGKLRALILDDALRGKIGSRGASRALDFGYECVAEAFLDDFNNLSRATNA
jgi:glycosyltransferase involved in cell wall biosynthesis